MTKRKKIILIAVNIVVIATLLFVFFETLAFKTSRKLVAVNTPDVVAELTIVTNKSGDAKIWGALELGHVFILVKNVTEQPFMLGKFNVAPNQQISVSSWAQSYHAGVWYNVETSYVAAGKYNNRLSLTKQINMQELSKVSTYIVKHDKWSYFNNCTDFSVGVWNAAASKSEKLNLGLISFPGELYKQIKNFNTYTYRVDMQQTTSTYCYKFGELQEFKMFKD